MARIHSKLTDGIRSRVKRLIAAEIDYSWKGSKPTSEWPAVTAERNKARDSLEQYLIKIDEPKVEPTNGA